MSMNYFTIALMLLSTGSAASSDQFWEEPCLTQELSKCGKSKLPRDPKIEFTPEQQEIFFCRVKALNKCRKKESQ